MKNNWPKKKVNITQEEVKEITKSRVEEMNKFQNDFFKNNSEDSNLTMVLKFHLYIEKLLNDIITTILPKPEKILEYKFVRKIELIESLNVIGPDVINDLRIINKLRNDFSHNLNKKLVSRDLDNFNLTDSFMNKSSLDAYLYDQLLYLVGYLHGFIAVVSIFPFAIHQYAFQDIYEKDKAYQLSKILKAYPIKETKIVVNELKIDEK